MSDFICGCGVSENSKKIIDEPFFIDEWSDGKKIVTNTFAESIVSIGVFVYGS